MSWLKIVVVLAALLCVSGVNALTFEHTYAYQDTAGADSTDDARTIAIDAARNILMSGSYADDAVNMWNISGTNASRVYYLGGRTSSANPGSLDGATVGVIYGSNYYVPSFIDDSFSIDNITTNTPVFLNGTATDAAPPQSQDQANAIAVTSFGGTTYAVVVSFVDDAATVWNVTNPKVVPTYLNERVATANPCSLDGAYSVEFINSSDFLVAAQIADTISWMRLSPSGAISCVDNYQNSSDIDRPYGLAYDGTTNIVYSGGLNGVVTALDLSNGSFVKLGQSAVVNGTPQGSGALFTKNGYRYGLFPLLTNGAGVAVVNLSSPSSPTYLYNVNGTPVASNVALGNCAWNASYSIGINGDRAYVGTGFGLANTGCLHVIEFSEAAASDSCTYGGSGAWVIQGSDNCVLSTVTDLNGEDVIVEGAGSITINSGGGFTDTLLVWIRSATLYVKPGAKVLQ